MQLITKSWLPVELSKDLKIVKYLIFDKRHLGLFSSNLLWDFSGKCHSDRGFLHWDSTPTHICRIQSIEWLKFLCSKNTFWDKIDRNEIIHRNNGKHFQSLIWNLWYQIKKALNDLPGTWTHSSPIGMFSVTPLLA